MSPAFVVPLVAALSLAVMVTALHRRLPPAVAARVVAVTTLVVAAAALPTLWILSLGFVAHLPVLGGFAWCTEVFGVHRQLPWWVGVPTTMFVTFGTVRAARVVRSYRRLRQDQPGSIEIASHDHPFAVTLPGRGGHIVLSSALLDLLDDAEQHVVVAHEEAHARHRHDRYLLTAQLCVAAIPMLRPLTSRLQFSIERWADEAAVDACGDRQLVAMTLGKVGLHGFTPAGVLGFGGLRVPGRVAALLGPPPGPARTPMLAVSWFAIAMTGALAAVQLHHLASAITALCPG